MKKISIVFMIMCTILFSGINAQAASLYKWDSKVTYTQDLPKDVVMPDDIRNFEIYFFDNCRSIHSPAWIYMDNKFYKFNLPIYFSRGLTVYGTPEDIPNNENGKYLGYSLLGNPVQDIYYIDQEDFKNVAFIKYPWKYEALKTYDENVALWNYDSVISDNIAKSSYTAEFKNMKTVNGTYLKDLIKGENYFDYVVPGEWYPDKRSFAVLYYIDFNNTDGNLKADIKKLYVMTDLKK